MSQLPVTDDVYNRLYKAVVHELAVGTERLKAAYQQELVRTYWNVGRAIEDTFGLDEKPSSRNSQIIGRLVADCKRPETFFYSAAKFYREYPVLPRTKLSWSHYSLLISVDDRKIRRALEIKAAKGMINSKDFRALVRGRGVNGVIIAVDKNNTNTLVKQRGKLYHYRLISPPADYQLEKEKVLVDIGFGIEHEIRVGSAAQQFHTGLIVRAVKKGGEYSLKIAAPQSDRLYTYKAVIKRVIDGDTLLARIDLGFRSWITREVRLRGVDAPELTSALGRKAKLYIEDVLVNNPAVVIKTHKDDKYGRFLADVYYGKSDWDPQEVAAKGTYLNQDLLDKSLVVLYAG